MSAKNNARVSQRWKCWRQNCRHQEKRGKPING